MVWQIKSGSLVNVYSINAFFPQLILELRRKEKLCDIPVLKISSLSQIISLICAVESFNLRLEVNKLKHFSVHDHVTLLPTAKITRIGTENICKVSNVLRLLLKYSCISY